MTPETMAGEALLEDIVEGYGDWEAEPFFNEAIVRIEAEARRAALEELRAELERLAPYDENDRIVAMNGTVRLPTTPADYVGAYRTRLLAAIDRRLA